MQRTARPLLGQHAKRHRCPLRRLLLWHTPRAEALGETDGSAELLRIDRRAHAFQNREGVRSEARVHDVACGLAHLCLAAFGFRGRAVGDLEALAAERAETDA